MGSLISAGFGMFAAGEAASGVKKGAGTAAGYMQQGEDYLKGIWGQDQANLQPYATTGQQALASIASIFGLPGAGGAGTAAGPNVLAAYNQFTKTPYYQFPLQSTMQSVNQQAGARGGYFSTGTMGDITKLAQGYGSQQFGNYMSGLGQLANTGQTAATSLGDIGIKMGGLINQDYSNIGQVLGGAQQQAAKLQAAGLQNLGTGIGNTFNQLMGMPSSDFGGKTNNPLSTTILQSLFGGSSSTPSTTTS